MPVLTFSGVAPKYSESTFVADNATLIGNVTLEENSSIWFGAVLRAEVDPIRVGRRSNIQDNCVIHTDIGFPVFIGDGVTVGHAAVVHGAQISSNCLIGMKATLMNGCRIGENCIVGAGSLVTQGTQIPSNTLVLGSPATAKRTISEQEIERIREDAEHYDQFRTAYLSHLSQPLR